MLLIHSSSLSNMLRKPKLVNHSFFCSEFQISFFFQIPFSLNLFIRRITIILFCPFFPQMFFIEVINMRVPSKEMDIVSDRMKCDKKKLHTKRAVCYTLQLDIVDQQWTCCCILRTYFKLHITSNQNHTI